MNRVDILPRFVILQHTLQEHREALRNRLSERRTIPALTPLAWVGEIGTWQGIEIACFAGGEPERAIVPVLEQSSVEYVLCLGLAGSLSTALRRGDLVAPVASVRGDGVTDYWADVKMPAVADVGALSALNKSARQLGMSISNGILYSSATWYREPDFIEQWAELGVVGIQMELAQYYLLSYLYGKKAAGLYVISDTPLTGEEVWRTGFRRDQVILDTCERSIDILLGAIESLSIL
jgi:uridine phosphorylase